MQQLGEDIIEMYKSYRVSPNVIYNKVVIFGEIFVVPNHYEILEKIGQGAYGMVVAAKDLRTEDAPLVAIKKISKAFEHKIIAKRTLRQLKMLRLLKEQLIHENLIKIDTIVLPRSRETFEDIYVVSELMDTDLASIIRKGKNQLTEKHRQFLIYQLLRGLKFLHSSDVIHRDLKPRNLLISQNCDLKICDFGLSRALTAKYQSHGKKDELTNYVITRWYRAPELLLNSTDYTKAVDMWSVGCIFAQLIYGLPFLKGKDTQHQLELICEKIGVPEIDNMDFLSQENKIKLHKMSMKSKTQDLSKIFTDVSDEAINLLQKLLKFNPYERITVQEALNHPYFQSLHDKDEEPNGIVLDPLQFEFQHHNITNQQFKDLIYQQILLYHSDKFREEYLVKKKNQISLIEHVLNNSNSKNIDTVTDSDDY